MILADSVSDIEGFTKYAKQKFGKLFTNKIAFGFR